MSKKLFKWLGGKSWLSSQLTERVSTILINNPKIDTYIEPFVGGLGSFLPIYDLIKTNPKIKKIIINDLNPAIYTICSYFKEREGDLILKLTTIENEFNKTLPSTDKIPSKKEELKIILAKSNEFYMSVRKKYNDMKKNNQFDADFVAHFLFLQFHAFNGIYRENGSGGHNVPFNWSPKPTNMKEKIAAIHNYHAILSDERITIFNRDAIAVLRDFQSKTNCLIYLDPPYINIDTNENKYTKEGFNYESQLNLVKEAQKFGHVLYSNHEHPEIERLFIDGIIDKIKRKNIVSSSGESRSEDKTEILVSWTNKETK